MTDRRILIVDDELSVRSSLMEWFREDGFVVETAEERRSVDVYVAKVDGSWVIVR